MAQKKKKKVNPEKNIRMNHNYVAIKKKKKQYFVLGSVNYCTSTIKIIFSPPDIVLCCHEPKH